MPYRLVVALAAAALVAACSPGAELAASPAGAPALPVPGSAQPAVVVRVSDGDTVRLRGRGAGPLPGDSTRVRLLLVDTPEVFDAVQCYGPEASARTRELLPEGSAVRVEADRDPTDRYGRALLQVWNARGVNVGLALVAEGYARVLQVDPNRTHLEQFELAEQQARAAGRGLWSAC